MVPLLQSNERRLQLLQRKDDDKEEDQQYQENATLSFYSLSKLKASNPLIIILLLLYQPFFQERYTLFLHHG
ncbi:hypothetical protein NC652_019010 [Populus alba x Populus x berolinensis]|uniref:Uncharacterized protein n=1 Tax=Populus alba x Populus x berolinensis TaxID=444605 RepID=A0AAD6VWA4_9ROSI|nr:hypothetical protein NC652_019010 [Populus alba x Populus x berolinensis]KAJ6990438.1 hypothetical protein NC653_018859 [Populus alba x Populus x berolinensis]